jgi:thiosulfate/3-mercaptopyruvate sulfurtransferase
MRNGIVVARRAVAVVAMAGLPIMTWALGPVVDAAWLAEHRDDVTVVQASRSADNFDGVGYIPGAAFVAMSEFLATRESESGTVRYLVPDAAAFEQTLRGLGVGAGDTVVIAPAGTKLYGDTTVAARLYWQMRYHGHDAVAVLDGGVAAWKAAGQPVAEQPVAPEAQGDFSAAAPREDLLHTTAEIAAVLDAADGALLLDNRPLVQFAGLVGKDYVEGLGHLPGAKPLPFDLFVRQDDGLVRWRGADEVQRLFAALGEPGRPAVAYCNSGHVSSLAWFALSEIGGIADVSLYDGSLHEWTRSGDRPLVVGR